MGEQLGALGAQGVVDALFSAAAAGGGGVLGGHDSWAMLQAAATSPFGSPSWRRARSRVPARSVSRSARRRGGAAAQQPMAAVERVARVAAAAEGVVLDAAAHLIERVVQIERYGVLLRGLSPLIAE